MTDNAVQHAQTFAELSRCTVDQLKMYRAFIDAQLNKTPSQPAWTSLLEQPTSFASIASPPPRTVIAAPTTPIIAKTLQPTNWFVDETGLSYTYVCYNGAQCGCRYYPKSASTPFSKHTPINVHATRLRVVGQNLTGEMLNVNEGVVRFVISDNHEEATITFEAHRFAADALHALQKAKLFATFVLKQSKPTDWFLDENNDRYTYVCGDGDVCGCRYYADNQHLSFRKHNHRNVTPLCLHLYGLDPTADYRDTRQHLINIIGVNASLSVRVNQGERYGFITFKDHSLASDAQQALELANQLLDSEKRILVNFALKNHKPATRKSTQE